MIDIRQLIEARVASDPRLKSVLKKIEAGSATLKDTAYFTEIYSNITGNAFGSNVLDLTDEEREAACMDLLRGNYEEINDICSQVQTSIDKAAGIHIKPQKAAFPLERVEQIAHSLMDPTVKDNVIKRRPNTGVANVSKSFHDDYIKVNAKFRKNAGLAVYLNRETDGNCCEWCSNMAGRYSYGSEPDDIYRRHDNCSCTVTYEDGKHRQDVWSKRTWTTPEAGVGAQPPKRYTPKQAADIEAKSMSRRTVKINNSSLDKAIKRGIIKENIEIGKSIGAASKNYPIKLPSGNHGKILEGTEITDVVTFAGKGTGIPIRNAKLLEQFYHIPAKEWEKVRGTAYIRAGSENKKAELHWYEARGMRVEMKVKKYYEEDEIYG